jgi:hypothetical protein
MGPKARNMFWKDEYDKKRAAVTAIDPTTGADMPYEP